MQVKLQLFSATVFLCTILGGGSTTKHPLPPYAVLRKSATKSCKDQLYEKQVTTAVLKRFSVQLTSPASCACMGVSHSRLSEMKDKKHQHSGQTEAASRPMTSSSETGGTGAQGGTHSVKQTISPPPVTFLTQKRKGHYHHIGPDTTRRSSVEKAEAGVSRP